MPKRIQMAGVGVVEFPDDATADEIKAAAEERIPSTRGGYDYLEPLPPITASQLGDEYVSHPALPLPAPSVATPASAPTVAPAREYDYLPPLPPITAAQLAEDKMPWSQRPALTVLGDEESSVGIPRIPVLGAEDSRLRAATEFARSAQESLAGTVEGLSTPEATRTLPLFALPYVGPALTAVLGTKYSAGGLGRLVTGAELHDPRITGQGFAEVLASSPLLRAGLSRQPGLSDEARAAAARNITPEPPRQITQGAPFVEEPPPTVLEPQPRGPAPVPPALPLLPAPPTPAAPAPAPAPVEPVAPAVAPVEMMTPEQFDAYKSAREKAATDKKRAEAQQRLAAGELVDPSKISVVLEGERGALSDALKNGRPVNAALLDRYNAGSERPLKLPEGYAREGEFYTRRAAQPVEAPAPAEAPPEAPKPAPAPYPNTGAGAPADEFGAMYGPTLTPAMQTRFQEQVGESFDLPSTPGTTTTLKVKPHMLWMEVNRRVPGAANVYETGVAYMNVRSNGETVLDASKHGRDIDKQAAQALLDFLDKTQSEKPATATPPAELPAPAPVAKPAVQSGVPAILASPDTPQAKSAALRKLAADQGVPLKDIQEQAESHIVQQADAIARNPILSPFQKFSTMVGLYNGQPTLSARTSTSVEQQAYSTPAPLSYALSYAAGVTPNAPTYDATAGNGMLHIGSNLAASHGNELNPKRAANLSQFGIGTVTPHDATTYTPGTHYPFVLLNPPFGPHPNVNVGGYGIKRLEHVIALRALDALTDDGVGTVIMGAKLHEAPGGHGAQWVFENYVYGHYNVVANFEVAGDLYAKQGASWPVRVLVVAGRKQLPVSGDLAPPTVARLNNWGDVWKEAERIRNDIAARRSSVVPGTPQPGLPEPAAPSPAPAVTGGHGKMVRFKSAQGDVVTGLLMPRNWTPANLVQDPRLDLVSGDAVARFLRDHGDLMRVEAKGIFRLGRGTRGYVISAPAAKSTGSAVFLDQALRTITGDFQKTGSRMIASLSEDKVQAAANRLMAITGSKLRAMPKSGYTGDLSGVRTLVQGANSAGGVSGPLPFFSRRSEAQGLGEPSTAPTVEDVHRQRLQDAVDNWRRAEKLWRRAMRQEPSERAATDDARKEAEGHFREAAEQAGISQAEFDRLSASARETETPTPVPPSINDPTPPPAGPPEAALDLPGETEITDAIRRQDVMPGRDWIASPEFEFRKNPVGAMLVTRVVEAELKYQGDVARDIERFKALKKGLKKPQQVAITAALRAAQEGDTTLLDVLPAAERTVATQIRRYFDDVRQAIIAAKQADLLESLPEARAAAVHDILGGMDEADAFRAHRLRAAGQAAVRAALHEFEELNHWGLEDYITNIERGSYKIVAPDGTIVAIAETRAGAHEKALRYARENPGVTRLTITDEFLSRSEFPTKLTRGQYFRMAARAARALGTDVAEIQQMLRAEGSPIVVVKPPSKFAGPMQHRYGILKGEDNVFDVLPAYAYTVRKKLALDPVFKQARTDLTKLPPNMQAQVEELLGDVRGRYSLPDQIADYLLAPIGTKPFAFSRGVGVARTVVANLKLGWRPTAALVNRLGGLQHTWTKAGSRYWLQGRAFLKTPEFREIWHRNADLVGATAQAFLEAGHSQMPWWHPLAMFQYAEKVNRPEAFASFYKYAEGEMGLSGAEAEAFARNSVRFAQFTYTVASLPRILRNPIGRIVGQFKAYLVKEMEFVASVIMSPQWKYELPRYISAFLLMGGPRAFIYFLRSLPVLGAIGALWALEDWLNRKAPRVSRGVPGYLGIDITPAVTPQLPSKPSDWLGPLISDSWKLWDTVLRPALEGQNRDFSDLKDWGTKLAPSMAYWARMLEAIGNREGWITDDQGRPLYKPSTADKVKLAFGAKPLEQSVQELDRGFLNHINDVAKANRMRLIGQIINALDKGDGVTLDKLLKDAADYGIDTNAIREAAKQRIREPDERLRRRLLKSVRVQEAERLSQPPTP